MFNKKKLEELEERIVELERKVYFSKIEIDSYTSRFHYDPKYISVKHALRLLLDHFGLELYKEPARPITGIRKSFEQTLKEQREKREKSPPKPPEPPMTFQT